MSGFQTFLFFAAPIDLRTKNGESFTPQLLQGFWRKLKKNNPEIVVMSPPQAKKKVMWQHYHLCLAVVEHQILGGKHFLILGPETGRILAVEEGTISPEKVPLPMDLTFLF